MNTAKALWAAIEGDPKVMRTLHGWLTVLWFLASVPICILLATSVPFLVFISVYAVVTGHFSSWQAARVEVKQDAQAKRERARAEKEQPTGVVD